MLIADTRYDFRYNKGCRSFKRLYIVLRYQLYCHGRNEKSVHGFLHWDDARRKISIPSCDNIDLKGAYYLRSKYDVFSTKSSNCETIFGSSYFLLKALYSNCS